MKAVRAQATPTLDGDVVNDAAWSPAEPATDFVQTTPNEGEPASEKTESFSWFFDDTTLYVGVVCHDRNPEGIIISDSRRDASLEETDSLQLILDTYTDRQSAFLFGNQSRWHRIRRSGDTRRRSRTSAPPVDSTSLGTAPGRSRPRFRNLVGVPNSPYPSVRCASPKAVRRPGVSISSATFAVTKRKLSGRRWHASSTWTGCL